MKDIPFGAWVFVVAVFAFFGALYLRALSQCEHCPPGSRGTVVRGMWAPECICEAPR